MKCAEHGAACYSKERLLEPDFIRVMREQIAHGAVEHYIKCGLGTEGGTAGLETCDTRFGNPLRKAGRVYFFSSCRQCHRPSARFSKTKPKPLLWVTNPLPSG